MEKECVRLMRTLRYERNGEQSQRRAAASSPTSGRGRTTSSDSAQKKLAFQRKERL
jgi:hypothetical protein